MNYVAFRLFRQIALTGGFSTRSLVQRKNISVVLHKLEIILKQNWEKQEENPILDRFVGQIKIKRLQLDLQIVLVKNYDTNINICDTISVMVNKVKLINLLVSRLELTLSLSYL